jgi:hypothetical protein
MATYFSVMWIPEQEWLILDRNHPRSRCLYLMWIPPSTNISCFYFILFYLNYWFFLKSYLVDGLDENTITTIPKTRVLWSEKIHSEGPALPLPFLQVKIYSRNSIFKLLLWLWCEWSERIFFFYFFLSTNNYIKYIIHGYLPITILIISYRFCLAIIITINYPLVCLATNH